MSILLFVFLFAFLFLAFPIAIALGLASTLIIIMGTSVPLTTIAQKVYTNLDSFALMAVPFFILASNLLSTGGVARRLINLANAVFGHIHGGLAVSTVAASSLFASISGSSPATVAAIGSIMIPAMINRGYGKNYAVGVTATAGTLGIMIPPSIAMILYGFATNESIGKLFIAGIIPGLMLAFMLAVVSYVYARMKGYARAERMPWPDLRKAFIDALPSLALPVIVIGGIYGGIFTPTEAAAIAVLVGFIVGMFIHPPVGLNLYVASGIAKMPLYHVMRAAAPWMLVMVAALLIITYVPEISLFLPRLVYR